MAKRIIIIFLAIVFLITRAAGDSSSNWFTLDPISEKYWQLFSDPGNERILVLKPKALSGGKNLLVLFPKASSAYDTAMNTILGVFYEKKVPANFTIINFEGEPYQGLKALDYAEKRSCDLIFSMGSRSTQFIYENYSGGRLPAVSVCSKDPVLLGQIGDYEKGSGTNIAFTSLDVSVDFQLIYLKRLKRNLKNIAIMYAQNNISAVATQVKPMIALAQKEGINIFKVSVEDQSNARQELKRKMPQVVKEMRQNDPGLLNSIFWITGSTSVFQEIGTINKLAQNIPVLSVVPDIVRKGEESAVLSIGISFENNALKAAMYAIDILEKKAKPGELKVGVVSPPDIAINFKKAKQIGLAIPFSFFESAGTIYDYEGEIVRFKGKQITRE